MMLIPTQKKKKGFAMLFTVLVITLILSIAISISNLTFKQTILSSLAKDSQISFYEADTAVECGLYHDTSLNEFPAGSSTGSVPPEIFCGNDTFSLLPTESYADYFVYAQQVLGGAMPCSSIVFDKATTPGFSLVQGRGYNICTPSPRQVERLLEVRY